MKDFRRRSALLLPWLGLLPGWASAAGGEGIVTILVGEAERISGIDKQALQVGQRLQPGDILRTGAAPALLRVEWPEGRHLSLGPASELMLAPDLRRAAAERRGLAAYWLRGWLKTNLAVASAAGDVAGGTWVGELNDGRLRLFSEREGLSLREPRGGSRALPAGDFVERNGGSWSPKKRPEAAFLTEMPAPFRDTLPPLRDRHADRPAPAAKPLGRPSYAELRPWLSAEPALRQELQRRWRPLVSGEFRQALEANMAAHPEWERILYPERFRPPVAR